uniref:Uncharacterized protein TCIL3000_11_13930 n=1 Tax=Trypanosoma congolense (strain IL3000) TaxID=1068625 RepID=G0V2L5_TRYCI|nr:unnamed protein product [Trypanosoma congolense IL3000]
MRRWAALRGLRLVQQRFMATDVPTEEEVRNAYATLGVATCSPFEDVKRRYVELAKQHHPDVNGEQGVNASSRMVNINTAYSTLRRLHQLSKGRLHERQGCPSGGRAGTEQPYYTSNDEPYQPWHEDLDPLFYEMMWEEMHRQTANEAFAQASAADEERRRYQQQQYRNAHQQRSDARGTRHNKAHCEDQKRSKGDRGRKKTTTWPDVDLQAMVNMYLDGKSFDFIANALGKKTSDVVSEFNRWSEDNRRPSRRHRHNNHNYYAGSSSVDFLCMDDDDDDENDNDGDIFFYHVPDDDISSGFADSDDDGFGSGPIPFKGGHQMSGHRSRRSGNNRQDKKAPSSRERGGGGSGRRDSRRRQW